MVARRANVREFVQGDAHVRTRSQIWGSLTLVLMVSGATSLATTTAADEQAVIAAEHQWLKAQQTNNPELLAPLLADKIVETTDEGKVFAGKDAVLADAKSDTWSSAEYTGLKVTLFEHTGIATGTLIGKGTSAGGKPFDVRVRFTDTWVKAANGKWLCIATQFSAVKT
jgi:uncharacterized protein (TIGR02246 family)